jgi:hypothetical protein
MRAVHTNAHARDMKKALGRDVRYRPSRVDIQPGDQRDEHECDRPKQEEDEYGVQTVNHICESL